MSFSAGPVVAIAVKKAVVPALSIWIGVIAATPEVAAMSFWSVCRRGSPARGSVAPEEAEAPVDEALDC